MTTDAQKAFAAAGHIWEIGVRTGYLMNCHGCSEHRPVNPIDLGKLKDSIVRLQAYVDEVENGSK